MADFNAVGAESTSDSSGKLKLTLFEEGGRWIDGGGVAPPLPEKAVEVEVDTTLAVEVGSRECVVELSA